MKRIATFALALLLPGCGLQPLYSGGANGAVAQAVGGIEVAPIPGKNGWLVGNALKDRIAAVPGVAPRYRLVVELDDKIEGFGVRRDDAITREPRHRSVQPGGVPRELVDLPKRVVVPPGGGHSHTRRAEAHR